jgi:tRNA threonylcarbamoyladenosine biosynthesis protein TsaE
MQETRMVLTDPEQTLALGETLGRLLAPGNVVALYGDLGAGKTCLTKGLARGLEVADLDGVSSPTFALVHEYPGRITLFHLDAYRLDADEFLAAGLDEYFDQGGVAAVEWADRLAGILPEARIEVHLEPDAHGGRIAVVKGFGPEFERLVSSLIQ